MNRHLSDLVLDHLLDGVLIVDQEGIILYANKAAEGLFGQSSEKLAGQNFGFPVVPYEVQQVELVSNGELRIVQMLASALPWNGQKACLLSMRDITHLVNVSQQLEKQKLQLENTNSDLEQYASLASHDLKEPVRKIMLCVEMLLKKIDTASRVDLTASLTKIYDSAVRMKMLMNGIAEFAKTNTDAKMFARVDLNEVVSEVLSDLEMTIAETQAKISVENLPAVKAVKIQMHQLFLNLISNAIKYAKTDVPPFIKIEQASGPEFVEISIADNGTGFDSVHAEKVFQPFQRLKKNEMLDGTGIGLTICKKIVEAHGGKIAATSKPGEGATFSFSLLRS